MHPDFILTAGHPLSDLFLAQGVDTFHSACLFVRHLPYGRNIDKNNPATVLQENRGTCSTKHALLKRLADENGHADIKLYTGIFKMNRQNTPQVAAVLDPFSLEYVPEAHCYLKYGADAFDYTFTHISSAGWFMPGLLEETEIQPTQITEYKVAYHRQFLETWLTTQGLPYTLDEIWDIREACIRALS